MTDTKHLGAEIGAAFAQEREEGSAQQREANTLADAVVAADPKVKLPRLLANPRIKAWQEANGVSDSHLKYALAKARSAFQAKATEKAVRVPPRKRQRTQPPATTGSNVSAVKPISTSRPNRGVVPNRSLDLL